MLRKLLKYDLRPTFRLWRILAPIFVFSGILFALLRRGLAAMNPERDAALYILMNVLHSFAYTVFVVSVGALAIGTLIMVLRRYIVNFCSDEGYLTFSLPVRREILYLSKVLSCAIWDTAFGVLLLAVGVIWDGIVTGGETVGGIFFRLFVLQNPVASAISCVLVIAILFAVDFFHINLVYSMAGSAAGYTGRRVNAGRIVLLAVLLYYVLPLAEVPLILLAVLFGTSASGMGALLCNVLLAVAFAAIAFWGIWIYFKNVRTLETRLNLS